jgi:SAM-dependent methyltransferase
MVIADHVNSQRRIGPRQHKANSVPFDELAREYDAWFDKAGSLIFHIETKAFREILTTLPKPWLEVGVGSGRFARELGIETGIDPSYKLIEMARYRGINSFLGRMEQKLFDEESFGTVFLICSLCFLDAPQEVLAEADRILMPGGKIVLGVVLKESPWGQLYSTKKTEGHRYYKHAIFYTYEEVAELIFQAGFGIERIISTLFQRPGKVHYVERHRNGYDPRAGFTIITAVKRQAG